MKRLATACVVTPLMLTALGAAPANADESPTIDDRATLVGGKVTGNGTGAIVNLRLKCPKGDRYTARMTLVLASDATATASGTRSGRCSGSFKTITLRLRAAADQPPLTPGCDAEYGVTVTGPSWEIAFDRGGADGGPDGPGPQLCLTGPGQR